MKLFRGIANGIPCFYRVTSGQTEIAPVSDIEFENTRLEAARFAVFQGEIVPMPVAEPSKVVCVGRNYADHAKELGNEIPQDPLLFLKAPSAIVGNENPIVVPPQSVQVEHEGELAIVIGRKAKDIGDNENVFNYVFGYSCLNDVTARDLQRKDGQFARAKSFDSFCPIGPHIETNLDAHDLQVSVRVNGETRQEGRTSQMIFDIPFLLRYISRQMTLLPGDVIATGTPSGVSRLETGDICDVEIEGIGTLSNPVTK